MQKKAPRIGVLGDCFL